MRPPILSLKNERKPRQDENAILRCHSFTLPSRACGGKGVSQIATPGGTLPARAEIGEDYAVTDIFVHIHPRACGKRGEISTRSKMTGFKTKGRSPERAGYLDYRFGTRECVTPLCA